eukprot:362018-Chlamydomonas_euryale.AAC.7
MDGLGSMPKAFPSTSPFSMSVPPIAWNPPSMLSSAATTCPDAREAHPAPCRASFLPTRIDDGVAVESRQISLRQHQPRLAVRW